MTESYSVEACRRLQNRFQKKELYRPMRVARYDAGTRLTYTVKAVDSGGTEARVKLEVEKFIGGGFAGQVYRVRLLDLDASGGHIKGLAVGGVYAVKILIPPSGASCLFRNALYGIGFQGPFQLQVNPQAARAGALWQKFIRRGARVRFGNENSVVNIYATFVDDTLGSCGEISEWVDGRTWRLEVDDRLDWLKLWRKGKAVPEADLGSPEYRNKFHFMKEFVALLHDMGAHEFARQYEWSTCKSQPNCLKRTEIDETPDAGLVAVDFRAGLALLPFLPMSPGDFKLILQGVMRGSMVQFDRGNLARLEQFTAAHPEAFEDMAPMMAELKACERIYRDSVPDITHNGLRLLYSRRLWSTMMDSAVTGWRVRNLADDSACRTLSQSRLKILFFILLGLIPWVGQFFRRYWGNRQWRRHYLALFTQRGYLGRAIRGKMAETAIVWHRAGRLGAEKAERASASLPRFAVHRTMSFLPIGLHHILTDWAYARERLDYILLRPVRLYFNAELREQWLRDMVTEGRQKKILTEEDAAVILSQIREPFIQKYLKSLAVHVCTLPVTQVVSVAIAVIYVMMHPELTPGEASAYGLAIIAIFQVVPVSPGSLVRGLYVVYLVIKERNFKDYHIAVFLGFFKYVGYLAFPIQMAYRYPVLARFMAAHWANGSVHIVPVFGESGALLEHWVYGLFYNWPLTLRRRIQDRVNRRAKLPVRNWHTGAWIMGALSVSGVADFFYFNHFGHLPQVKEIWPLALVLPLVCGAGITYGFGGAALGRRFIGAALSGLVMGICYGGVSAGLGAYFNIDTSQYLIVDTLWRMFVFSLLTTIGAIAAELKMSDPGLRISLQSGHITAAPGG